MSDSPRIPADLSDAAAVHAAREEIIRALAPLVASPLDEDAVARMRRALESAGSDEVRRAVRRLRAREDRPPGVVVATADRAGDARPQAPPVFRAVRSAPGGGAA